MGEPILWEKKLLKLRTNFSKQKQQPNQFFLHWGRQKVLWQHSRLLSTHWFHNECLTRDLAWEKKSRVTQQYPVKRVTHQEVVAMGEGLSEWKLSEWRSPSEARSASDKQSECVAHKWHRLLIPLVEDGHLKWTRSTRLEKRERKKERKKEEEKEKKKERKEMQTWPQIIQKPCVSLLSGGLYVVWSREINGDFLNIWSVVVVNVELINVYVMVFRSPSDIVCCLTPNSWFICVLGCC